MYWLIHSFIHLLDYWHIHLFIYSSPFLVFVHFLITLLAYLFIFTYSSIFLIYLFFLFVLPLHIHLFIYYLIYLFFIGVCAFICTYIGLFIHTHSFRYPFYWHSLPIEVESPRRVLAVGHEAHVVPLVWVQPRPVCVQVLASDGYEDSGALWNGWAC